MADVNLNSVCERLEQNCCVDQNQHNLVSSQPQTPVLKRHSNTGAKLWGRVRSKLLRQKVDIRTCRIHTLNTGLSMGFVSVSLPYGCVERLAIHRPCVGSPGQERSFYHHCSSGSIDFHRSRDVR